MINAQQGDILKIEGISFPVLVVSKDFFNQTGSVVVCPILLETIEGPLHIKIEEKDIKGFVLCENIKYMDLSKRRYTLKGNISINQIIEITGAIQSIFDYV